MPCDLSTFLIDACLSSLDQPSPFLPLAVLFEVFLALLCMCGIYVIANEFLAKAAETFCIRLKIPEDVAGATILSFGDGAPEVLLSTVSTIKAVAKREVRKSQMKMLARVGAGVGAMRELMVARTSGTAPATTSFLPEQSPVEAALQPGSSSSSSSMGGVGTTASYGNVAPSHSTSSAPDGVPLSSVEALDDRALHVSSLGVAVILGSGWIAFLGAGRRG